MAKTASHEKKDRSRPWQRAATRASILDAARRLIERVGTDNLSLTAVAREAGFAPATVFAYFANKNDLFLSVLAADLASFGRTMREHSRQRESSSEDAAAIPDEAIATPSVVEQYMARGSEDAPKLRLVEPTPFDPGLDADDTPDWASQEEIATLLRDALADPTECPASAEVRAPSGEAPAPGDILRELDDVKAAIARLEARPVDQWLERRLREFERGLTALETRPEKAEIAANLKDLDDAVRRLATRVETIENRQAQATDDIARAMRERGEQIEKRLREFLSDVEAANARATTRLDALENAAFAVAPEFFHTTAGIVAPETPAPSPAAAVAEPIFHETPPVSVPPVAEQNAAAADVPVAGAGNSYLSAARRSALAAAQNGPTTARPVSRSRRLSTRTLAIVATCLGLVVALIWTGVFVRAVGLPAAQTLPKHPLLVAKARKPASKPDAQTLLLRSAQGGNAKAQLALALDFLNGPRRNDAMAAHWLLAAAQRGEALAAFKLATLYRSGRGVTADAGQSFRWFETAARKGNTKAMQDLAVAYAEGWGTEKNPSEAARWFTRAARLGLTDAQFNLGVLYEQGLGVPQSPIDAYKWYLVAAGAGDREAEMRVEAIKPQLASSDVAAAEEAAATFKPASPDRDANTAPPAPHVPAG